VWCGRFRLRLQTHQSAPWMLTAGHGGRADWSSRVSPRILDSRNLRRSQQVCWGLMFMRSKNRNWRTLNTKSNCLTKKRRKNTLYADRFWFSYQNNDLEYVCSASSGIKRRHAVHTDCPAMMLLPYVRGSASEHSRSTIDEARIF
jgi:hypothetical protein